MLILVFPPFQAHHKSTNLPTGPTDLQTMLFLIHTVLSHVEKSIPICRNSIIPFFQKHIKTTGLDYCHTRISINMKRISIFKIICIHLTENPQCDLKSASARILLQMIEGSDDISSDLYTFLQTPYWRHTDRLHHSVVWQLTAKLYSGW